MALPPMTDDGRSMRERMLAGDLLTPTHPVEPEPRRAKWEAARPITIGDNVWLGGGAIICPGVTIGHNTVVGAGAVVARDVPANVVAYGNPARVAREIRP